VTTALAGMSIKHLWCSTLETYQNLAICLGNVQSAHLEGVEERYS